MEKINHAYIMLISSSVQVIGIVLIFNKITIGMGMIFVSALFHFLHAVKSMQNSKSSKICKKYNSNIQESARVSQICGYAVEAGSPEEELPVFIGKEKKENMTPALIGRHFKEIEELAVEEMANFDGDIEAFLKRKEGLDI